MTENKLNSEKIKVRDLIKIDEELLKNISSLIDVQDSGNLQKMIVDIHSADIAEIINHLKLDDAEYLFNLLATEMASEVVVEIDENLREKILKKIDAEKISNIIDELEIDDATDIVSYLSDHVAEHVLGNMDVEDSEYVKELLKYPEDSAGGLMDSDYVFVDEKAYVSDAIEEVRKNAEEFEHMYYVHVLGTDKELKGVIELKSLLLNPLDKKISSIMKEDLIYVTPLMDQEEVANLIMKYDLLSIPVVDENKKMLGRITVDDIVDVIQEEADEDLQKAAGLSEEQESSDSIFRISRIRLPWLIIALFIEMIGPLVLSKFANIIYEQLLIAAFFIPVVMAMGGSSGTQASIVMVKGLGEDEVWLRSSIQKLFKEFLVAILNGLVLGSILFLISAAFFRDNIDEVLIITLCLLIIIIFATMIGAIVPIILKKINIDPAVATGPFVTTLNDVFGLCIYILIITIFLFP